MMHFLPVTYFTTSKITKIYEIVIDTSISLILVPRAINHLTILNSKYHEHKHIIKLD